MLTKDQLLSARQWHLEAARHFDELLKLYGRNEIQAPTSKPATAEETPAPIRFRTRPAPPPPPEENQDAPISYKAEIKRFLRQLPDSREFTMTDFKDYLVDKYGDRVNEVSIAVPFRKQKALGAIILSTAGVGKTPHRYRKAPSSTTTPG